MTDQEKVLQVYEDARIVYNFKNKPFVLSNNHLFQGRSADTTDGAWNNALLKIEAIKHETI